MTQKNRRLHTYGLDILFTVLVGGVITFSWASRLLAASVLGPLSLSYLIMAFLFVLGYRLFMQNAYTVIAGGVLLAGGLFFSHYQLRANDFSSPWFITLMGHVRDLGNFLFRTGPLSIVDRTFLAALLMLIIGLFVTLNLHALFHVTTLTLTGLVIFIAPFFFGYPGSPRDASLFLFGFLAILLKRLNSFANPPELRQNRRLYNVTFGPLALLLALLITGASFVLPKPKVATHRSVETMAWGDAKTTPPPPRPTGKTNRLLLWR